MSPRWTEVSLNRSNGVSLWVRVHSSPLNREATVDFMRQVAPHAERFRECRLNLQPMDAELVLRSLSSQSTPLLHLPLLAYLSIDAPFAALVQFLSRINIPATTKVKLRYHLAAQPNADNCASFYAFISQRFSDSGIEATSVAPIRTMVIGDLQGRLFITFTASERKCTHRTRNSSIFEECDCDIPLKVDIYWRTHTEDLVVGLRRSLPLAQSRNLILDRCRLSLTFLIDIFWHLGALRHMELIGGDFMDILISLCFIARPPLENADRPRTSQLFAPSLEELYLNGVRVPRNLRCGGDPRVHGGHMTLFREAQSGGSCAQTSRDHRKLLI
ncbi:hypothetical protein OG21DRAFT_1483510 [Imleria badia]|nr:hypothetical protein OG21DRAFT_1483510 [Imleria badia]